MYCENEGKVLLVGRHIGKGGDWDIGAGTKAGQGFSEGKGRLVLGVSGILKSDQLAQSPVALLVCN